MASLEIAKLFPNGGSQAVRLPKKFSFEDSTEVYIHKCGNKLILEPVHYSWKPLLEGLALLPDDFTMTRDAPDYSDKGDLL
jgi:antitoxin VapB